MLSEIYLNPEKFISVLYQVDNDWQDWLSNTGNCRMIEQLTFEECDWGRGKNVEENLDHPNDSVYGSNEFVNDTFSCHKYLFR